MIDSWDKAILAVVCLGVGFVIGLNVAAWLEHRDMLARIKADAEASLDRDRWVQVWMPGGYPAWKIYDPNDVDRIIRELNRPSAPKTEPPLQYDTKTSRNETIC